MSDNPADLVCQAGDRLFNEGLLVLATEAGSHGAVLSAVADGRTKFGEIRDAVGHDPTGSVLVSPRC